MNPYRSFQAALTALGIAALMGMAGCGGESYDSALASAKQFLARSDPASAMIQLRNALQQRPDAGEARFLLGQALYANGDLTAALIELGKAGDQKHPKEAVVPLTARVLLAQNQARQVIDRFSKANLAFGPAEADLQTTLAAAFEMQGDDNESQRALAAAFQNVKDFPPALVLQSRFTARKGDYAAALKLVESALAADPGLGEGWRLKGDYLFNSKAATADVIAAYRKAVDVKKTDVEAHSGILNVLMDAGDFDAARTQVDQMRKVLPAHPATLRFDMMLAYQRKELQRAREIGQQLLKVAPQSAQALYLAGAVEYESQAFAKAEPFLAKALLVAPNMARARRLLAQTYLRSGQGAKAVTTLAPAIEVEKPDADILSLAGEAYLQSGDMKKSEQFFQRAARANPNEPRGRTVLALSKLSRGATEAGFDELRAIASGDTGTGADMALIREHLRRREFDQALAAIAGMERKAPDKPFAPNLRGMVLLARNDVAGARKSLEQALARDAGFFPAAATLATIDLAEKKPEQAEKRFDAVLAADPKNVRAVLAKAEVRERSGGARDDVVKLIRSAIPLDAESPAARIALVNFYLRGGDVKQALGAAQEGVAAIPNNPELLDSLAGVQMLGGDNLQAVETYNRLAQVLPQAPLPFLRLAEAHVAARNLPAAESNLRRALELAPDLAAAQRRLVEVQLALNKSKDASIVAAALQKRQPEQALGFLLEGDVHASEKRWPQAIKAYRAGLGKAGGAELAIRLHAALLASGDQPGANDFSAGWLKEHDGDLAFLSHLGGEAAIRGDYARAEQYFGALLRQRPDDGQALNNLAWIFDKQGKPGARAYSEKAVSLDPNNAAYLDTLASVLEREKQLPKAVEVQKKAVELLPNNPVLRLKLAKLCIKQGDKAQARQHLDLLANTSGAFPGSDEVAALRKSL